MKKLFIFFLFIILGCCLSAQNNVLNFSKKSVSVKEKINIPIRNVVTNQNYIELEYYFEEAVTIDEVI